MKSAKSGMDLGCREIFIYNLVIDYMKNICYNRVDQKIKRWRKYEKAI